MAPGGRGGDRASRYTIGHVLPWPAVGGTEHATVRIAGAIEAARFTSVAFHLSGADSVARLFADAGIRTVPYEPAVPSYRHALRFLSQSLALGRTLRQHHVDLLHCADYPAAHHAALAGWLMGIPVVCHVRNRFDTLSRRDCSFLWPVSRFVFVSRDTWRRFAYGVTAGRGSVVYDGIDLPGNGWPGEDRASVRREFDIPDEAPIVGMLARVAPQKDVETLVRAAARVLTVVPAARFVVAGDYTSADVYRRTYQRVQRLMAECGVGHAFIFTGHRQDVSRLLAALDIFVLSTHWEGLPLVILEAMAHGKPVVATAVDGIPELITHEETGLLFAHEDHEELATHLIRLLQDRTLLARMGAAGRSLVGKQFGTARFGVDMNAVYDELLQGPRTRGLIARARRLVSV